MSKDFTPEMQTITTRPNGICLAYVGYEYLHNDRTGRGTCIDMFNEKGKLAKCKDTIKDGRCPKNRAGPYDEVKPDVT